MSYSFGWIEIHCVDHCNNSCLYCNNHSPFAPKKEYTAEMYTKWLDKIIDSKIQFYCISIMGGEPFLHSNLEKFVTTLRDRYTQSLMLTTNGFWLSENNISKYENIFKNIDILCFSLYPSLEKTYGSFESARNFIARIQDLHRHIKVEIRTIKKFTTFQISHEPNEVDRYCGAADCTCLLPDGRMGRCGIGSFAHLTPHATPSFLNAPDMFYDLDNPQEDFWLWRKRWPLEACKFCNHFKCEQVGWSYTQRIPPRKM